MKRGVVFILVFILLASLISIPVLFLHLSPTPASKIQRQVDPATAPSEIVYGPGLYLFYGAVIASIDSGNLSGVKALLAQAGFLHIPSEVADAVNTFNGLLNSTAHVLAATNTELRAANSSLSIGRASEATPHIQSALSDLRVANGTITELEAAAPRLASLTGIPTTLFVQKVESIASLYSNYASEARRLQSQIAGLTKLEQTALTLAVSPLSIETGSKVVASGTLDTSTGAPLASKTVTVFLSGSVLGSVATDSRGRFSASLPTPFVYQSMVSLFASYLPVGGDMMVYSPSSSASVQVNVTFTSPGAVVEMPKSVYAGLPLSINGTLSAKGLPLSGYVVSLGAFGADLTAKTTKGGGFSFYTVAPASAGAGSYTLTLQTSGNSTVGPLAKQLQLNVVKLDPAITVNVPAIAIAGLGITITGSAEVNGSGLQGAGVVNVTPGPSVNVTTSGSGSFSFRVTPPLSVSTGGWTYTLGVYPRQTWISPTRVNVTVTVINPLTLVVPILSGGALFMVVRRRRGPRRTEVVSVPVLEVPPPSPPAPEKARSVLAGIYLLAMELVQRRTSLAPRPQQTLREYLIGVKGSLPGSEHFEFITFAFEGELYGSEGGPRVESWAKERLGDLRRALET